MHAFSYLPLRSGLRHQAEAELLQHHQDRERHKLGRCDGRGRWLRLHAESVELRGPRRAHAIQRRGEHSCPAGSQLAAGYHVYKEVHI